MGSRVLPQRRRKRGARPQPKHRMDGSFKVSKVGKYNAQGKRIDGHFFASDAEAQRYIQLRRLEEAGRIRQLELQPVYRCTIENRKICDYRADFRYRVVSETGMVLAVCIEDVKGIVLNEYLIKKKLTEALYRIEVDELPAQWIARYEGLTAIECRPIVKELGDVKAARKKARLAKARAAKKAEAESGEGS